MTLAKTSPSNSNRPHHTALKVEGSSRVVRVTHPFHPLSGREIEWVERRRSGRGEQRLRYRDEDGVLQSMPLSWTDLEDVDPLVDVAAGRAWLRADELIRLVVFVSRLVGEVDEEGGHV